MLIRQIIYYIFFFFFNDTATTEIYTLSLHDALPISLFFASPSVVSSFRPRLRIVFIMPGIENFAPERTLNSSGRSEEHTSELQSQSNLVCRLLLEKKKNVCSRIVANINTMCVLSR